MEINPNNISHSSEIENTLNPEDILNTTSSSLFEPNTINTMNVTEFLRLAGSTINKNYGGDPLTLTAFVNSVELLKSVASSIFC